MKIKTLISSIILLIVVLGGHAQTKEGAMQDAKLAAQGSMSKGNVDDLNKTVFAAQRLLSLMGGEEEAAKNKHL
jgi:hypothetical protein